MKCSHVIEVVEGGAYAYCKNEDTVIIHGNPFCPVHAAYGQSRTP